MRNSIIVWISQIANKLGLSARISYIAIAYFDYINSKYDYRNTEHYLIAITCLKIAAKYDELDCRIPFTEDFIIFAGSKLYPNRKEAIHDCEMKMLSILNWSLNVTTVLTVMELLFCQGILYSTDKFDKNGKDVLEIARKLREKILLYVDNGIKCNLLLRFNN